MNFGLEKGWVPNHCLFWKTVEKTLLFLDGSYVTEPSSVRNWDREEFTPERKVLKVDHQLCGCIAVDEEGKTQKKLRPSD